MTHNTIIVNVISDRYSCGKMATKSPQKTIRLRRATSMNKAEDIYKEEFKDRKNQPDKP